MEDEVNGVGFSWQRVWDLNSAMAKLSPVNTANSVQAVLTTTGRAVESRRSAYAECGFCAYCHRIKTLFSNTQFWLLGDCLYIPQKNRILCGAVRAAVSYVDMIRCF